MSKRTYITLSRELTKTELKSFPWLKNANDKKNPNTYQLTTTQNGVLANKNLTIDKDIIKPFISLVQNKKIEIKQVKYKNKPSNIKNKVLASNDDPDFSDLFNIIPENKAQNVKSDDSLQSTVAINIAATPADSVLVQTPTPPVPPTQPTSKDATSALLPNTTESVKIPVQASPPAEPTKISTQPVPPPPPVKPASTNVSNTTDVEPTKTANQPVPPPPPAPLAEPASTNVINTATDEPTKLSTKPAPPPPPAPPAEPASKNVSNTATDEPTKLSTKPAPPPPPAPPAGPNPHDAAKQKIVDIQLKITESQQKKDTIDAQVIHLEHAVAEHELKARSTKENIATHQEKLTDDTSKIAVLEISLKSNQENLQKLTEQFQKLAKDKIEFQELNAKLLTDLENIQAYADLLKTVEDLRQLANRPKYLENGRQLTYAQRDREEAAAQVATITTQLQALQQQQTSTPAEAQQQPANSPQQKNSLQETKAAREKLERQLLNQQVKIDQATTAFNNSYYFPYTLFDVILKFFGRPTYESDAQRTSGLENAKAEQLALQERLNELDILLATQEKQIEMAEKKPPELSAFEIANELQNQIAAKIEELTDAQTLLTQAEEAWNTIHTQISDEDSNQQAAQQKLSLWNDQKIPINANLEKIQLEISSIDSKNEQLNNEINALNKSIDELSNQLQLSQQALDTTTRTLETEKTALQIINDQIKSSKTSLAESQAMQAGITAEHEKNITAERQAQREAVKLGLPPAPPRAPSPTDIKSSPPPISFLTELRSKAAQKRNIATNHTEKKSSNFPGGFSLISTSVLPTNDNKNLVKLLSQQGKGYILFENDLYYFKWLTNKSDKDELNVQKLTLKTSISDSIQNEFPTTTNVFKKVTQDILDNLFSLTTKEKYLEPKDLLLLRNFAQEKVDIEEEENEDEDELFSSSSKTQSPVSTATPPPRNQATTPVSPAGGFNTQMLQQVRFIRIGKTGKSNDTDYTYDPEKEELTRVIDGVIFPSNDPLSICVEQAWGEDDFSEEEEEKKSHVEISSQDFIKAKERSPIIKAEKTKAKNQNHKDKVTNIRNDNDNDIGSFGANKLGL